MFIDLDSDILIGWATWVFMADVVNPTNGRTIAREGDKAWAQTLHAAHLAGVDKVSVKPDPAEAIAEKLRADYREHHDTKPKWRKR